MKLAYELFPAPHQARDSSLILCFRELWQRLELGQEPTPLDYAQIEHMAGWLEERVEHAPLAGLELLCEAIRQGWELILDGVLTLADFLEQGERALLDRALDLAEEGEQMLKELEEGIVDARQLD